MKKFYCYKKVGYLVRLSAVKQQLRRGQLPRAQLVLQADQVDLLANWAAVLLHRNVEEGDAVGALQGFKRIKTSNPKTKKHAQTLTPMTLPSSSATRASVSAMLASVAEENHL